MLCQDRWYVLGRISGLGHHAHVKVEPLPYVLVDTLHTMPRQQAMVILDAALAGNYGYGLRVGESDLREAQSVLNQRQTDLRKKL